MATEKRYSILKWFVYLLALIYIINCFSPLRLHVDTLRYFAILDCIENGCPPNSVAAKDYLPYGYTALLIGLSKIGLLKSSTIIAVNCVFLFLSLGILIRLFQFKNSVWLFVSLVLLNWTIIKFVLHPLSEMQYLFFSIASLYFFHNYTKEKKMYELALAILFAGAAFITRTVGVSLLAALAGGLLWEFRTQLLSLIKRNKIIVVGSVVVFAIVLLFSKQLGLFHYTKVLGKQFTEGVQYIDMLRWHFIEITEVSANLPFTKVVDFMPSVIRLIFLLLGIAVVITFVVLLIYNRSRTPVSVMLYLIFYSLLLFNWPFYDPRFWVPILPLCIAIISTTPNSLPKFQKRFVYGAGLVYAIFGLISIGYFSYTSFDKRTLAKTQASGSYKNEYDAVFFENTEISTINSTDSVVVEVLKRYN